MPPSPALSASQGEFWDARRSEADLQGRLYDESVVGAVVNVQSSLVGGAVGSTLGWMLTTVLPTGRHWLALCKAGSDWVEADSKADEPMVLQGGVPAVAKRLCHAAHSEGGHAIIVMRPRPGAPL